MKKHLFHAVCLFFLTMMMFVTPVFAEGLSDLKQAAKAYQNTVVEKHQSKRSLDKVKKDLDFELKKRYPNRQRVRDLRMEYIANGAKNSNSWLMLMNDMAQYRAHWRNNKYYFSSYLPSARSFWEPKDNLMILAGVNALILSKNTKDEENAYREIMALLKTINDHTQAGKGGYKLFALEYEIAEDVLKKTDLPLSKEAKERIAAVEVLLTQKTLKHELKKNSENPQLCFHMRLPLKQRGVKYEDYLRITPQTKVTAVPMKNKQLCVRGFDYAVDYEVELLKAVPTSLNIGHAMTESYKRRVNFGDRKPFVRLSKGKYILSRETMDGLPVETVNVDKVQIKIVKAMTERALPHNAHALDSNLRSYNFSSYFHTKGEPIWTGEMDIANMQNKNVTTYFPIDKVMAKPAPGVYAIEAEVKKDNKRLSIAHQYFVVTDIGMTALTAENGLYIFARSLKTAQPLAGVSLSLLSRNNTVLGTGITDKKGVFRFPAALTKGEAGLAPMLVNARGQNDYALIRLNKAAYDLSDRGVAGRAYPGPIDTFVYMDRGVYRPGESANIVALARDQQGKALPDVPLTIKVKRPDWVDFTEKTYSKTQLGGVHLGVDIPKNARMGSWTVQVYSDPTSAPIGTTTFRVEEYVPPQIEAKLTTKHDSLKTDTDYLYNLQGDYLYGAPAAGLKTTSEIVVFKDDRPFEKYKDYTFGLVQDTFTPRRFTVTPVRTDEGGAAQITANVAGDVLADISVPLTARLRTSIFEKGGRPVSTTLDRPLRHKQVYIGIKERESKDSGQKQNKVFELIALDQNGNRIALDGLEYKMVKEEYFYNWYNAHYGWRYERQYFDTPLDKNIVSIPKDKPLVITTASSVDYWWRHRIEVVDHKSGAATSLYASGYWGTSDEDTPDTVDVSAIDRSIAVGKKAEVLIKPPYGGEATIVVAHNEVLDVQQTYIPASGKKITLDVKDNWGAGAYVLVSVIRPGTEIKKQRGGMRGIGLTWLSVDRETSKLKVSFDVPDKVLPRQTFSLPVKVDGLAKGEKSFVTVAAVDEGVLQLTGFKNPDPFAFYFGQRRLGIMMRDIYGKLLKGADGLVGKIRSGGGAMRSDSQAGDAFDPDNYIKTVALFSGVVTPDKNGNVSVPLELPDFNGRLRLMAVAYSKDKIGQGAGDLVVRDPVIVDGSLPRFLAPEDKTQLTLRVQNLDGEVGVYKVSMTTSGAVTQDGVATYDLTLAKGAEETLYLPIKTKPMTGGAKVTVNVSGPKGFALTKDWAFDVRPYQILHTEDLLNKIAPSKTYALSKEITDKYWPGTVSASALLSARKNLNVSSLVESLRRYPYGCTEQLVSSASPLFHLNKLKKDWKLNIADDEELIKIRVQNSIRRVANNMRGNGSFGYWRAQDDTNVWLSAYATEYLLRGKQAGYDVSTEVLKKALSNLKRHVANPGTHPEQLAAASYAFYVLAKAGEIEVGKLRYFYDLHADKIEVNWALAMLGSGLNHFGEKTRAKEAFEKALNAVENDKPYHYWYYGSKLRNKAVLLAMLAENQNLSLRGDQLLDELVTAYEKQKYFSTQEQVWLTRAAVNMDPKKAGDIKFMIAPNFETIQTDKPYTVDVAKEGEDFSDLKVENMGDEPIYLRLSVLGAPKAALPAEEKGFKITRSYFTLDGEPALVEGKVKQNTLLVAVVEGHVGKYQNRSNENLVVDMLPAGFELENAALSGGKSSSELGWIMKDKEKTKPSYEALKDDRYVASFRKKNKFKLVYLVRAVTPGVYAHPAVYVEDMYHPGIYGRGASGTVTIVEDKE